MSLIDNICSCLGLVDGAPCSFRIVLLGEIGAYLEGVKKILSFTPSEVVLLVGKTKIFIKGENFKIKKFCGQDLALLGKICSVAKND